VSLLDSFLFDFYGIISLKDFSFSNSNSLTDSLVNLTSNSQSLYFSIMSASLSLLIVN
jgi:hypothetical protein